MATLIAPPPKADPALADALLRSWSPKIKKRELVGDPKSGDHEEALGTLRTALARMFIDYPQYDGMFKDMVLGRMLRGWKGKTGVLIPAGDLVLVKPKCELDSYFNNWVVSVYSPRASYGSGVSVYDIEIL